MLEFVITNYVLIGLVFAAGIAAGYAGGLFGIGGGIVMVPSMYAVFKTLGIAETPSLKAAIGTSLGVIIVTSFRSLTTHYKTGYVDREILRAWAPWISIGAAGGGLIARWAPVEALTIIFAGGALFVAWRRMMPRKSDAPAQRDLLRKLIKIPVGLGTGLFSSLMGLGGGAVGVLVMTASGRAIHQAVATSAGFGIAVAAPGVVGFMVSGQGAEGLPAGSFGYFNAPAFAAMAIMAAIAAPFGARLAHRTNPGLLSRLFGIYVAIAALAMLFDVFSNS